MTEGWLGEVRAPRATPHPPVGGSSPQGEPRGVGDAAPYTQSHGGCRGEHCSPARILRRRQTPRANTVRPYTRFPIGPAGRGLAPSKAPCVITTLPINRRGGFHIRPCSLARLPHPPTKNEGHPHQVSLAVIQPEIYASVRSFFTRLKITAPTTLPMASATRYSSA